MEETFTEQHGKFLEVLEQMRLKVIDEVSEPNMRKAILGKLCDDSSFDYFINNGSEKWLAYANELI